MKELKTIHGETIIVDDEDYEKARQYRWTTRTNNGKKRVLTTSKELRGQSYKHVILNTKGKWTTHKNGNNLDFRKENIIVFETKSEYARAVCKHYLPKHTKEHMSKMSQRSHKFSKKNKKYIGVHHFPNNLRP